jgi:thioredoxin-like negative regulator of GroEL
VGGGESFLAVSDSYREAQPGLPHQGEHMSFLKRLLGLEATPTEVVSVDDENFRAEVLASPLPVLIDVWGPGCAPCEQLAPIVIGLARQYKGRLKVVEISTERAPKTVAKLRVSATPTVIYMHKRCEMERVVGLRSSLYHREYIDEELLSKIQKESHESRDIDA